MNVCSPHINKTELNCSSRTEVLNTCFPAGVFHSARTDWAPTDLDSLQTVKSRRWRIVHCMVPHHLTWRRHSHVSPTCRTEAGSGPPPLNSLTFRPVVGQLSEVVPFMLLEQRLWNGLPSDVTSASSLSVFKNGLKTYLFRLCYETVRLRMTFPFPSHHLPPQNSGPCNSSYCLGHFKNVYDDDGNGADGRLLANNENGPDCSLPMLHRQWDPPPLIHQLHSTSTVGSYCILFHR